MGDCIVPHYNQHQLLQYATTAIQPHQIRAQHRQKRTPTKSEPLQTSTTRDNNSNNQQTPKKMQNNHTTTSVQQSATQTNSSASSQQLDTKKHHRRTPSNTKTPIIDNNNNHPPDNTQPATKRCAMSDTLLSIIVPHLHPRYAPRLARLNKQWNALLQNDSIWEQWLKRLVRDKKILENFISLKESSILNCTQQRARTIAIYYPRNHIQRRDTRAQR